MTLGWCRPIMSGMSKDGMIEGTGRVNSAVFPRGYLPMDCPTCGRRRLEYGVNADGAVVYVECEKCGANSDDDTFGGPAR